MSNVLSCPDFSHPDFSCPDLSRLDLVCILGPTASGKTSLAVRLARELGGCEIVSADSRQVYRGMDIGTGKDISEYGDIPYHLIDIVDPGDGYNVYRFKNDFGIACKTIHSRGKFPILCGGTGLYINSVINDYDFLEKKPLSEEREIRRDRILVIGTDVDRDTRNARIDARLDARLKQGMVEEVQTLLNGGVSAETLIAYGLEYKFVTLFLLGEMSYDEMKTKLATAIHQFAKRQMTWFRGMERSGVTINWIQPSASLHFAP